MDGEAVPMRIPQNDPVAIELRLAVRGGDLETVGRLLAFPGAAAEREPVDEHDRASRSVVFVVQLDRHGVFLADSDKGHGVSFGIVAG